SLVRGVHCRIEDSPSPLNFVGSFSAGQFGVPYEPGGAMAGHIEFRHHPNTAIARVGDQVADFILRVIKGVGAQFVKFRKFPALRLPESLCSRDRSELRAWLFRSSRA